MPTPENVSLKALGLMAPDGLVCFMGGTHHITEPELQVAVGDAKDRGVAYVKCRKCDHIIELLPIDGGGSIHESR